ncbi:hypothetical protein ASG65_11560 [Bacillus sp. Leaf13]|nr:hypothetical protein ASG65_11560 [Bacillus sp. Leaf13]
MQAIVKKSVFAYNLSIILFVFNFAMIATYLLSFYGFIPSTWMDVLIYNSIISFIAFLLIQIKFKNKTPLLYFFQVVNLMLFFVPIGILIYAIYKFLNY